MAREPSKTGAAPTRPTRVRQLVGGQISIDVLLSFIFGTFFICVMLAFAIFMPNPEPLAVWVFITVLSLAAAGVGAMIPGVINVDVGGWVRAGGALALFVVVYFNQPTLTRVIPIILPPTSGEEAALPLLAALDRGEVDTGWNLLDPIAREHIGGGKVTWERLFATVRAPLGAALSRQLFDTQTQINPPGSPVGGYRQLTYKSKFGQETNCRQEMVGLRAASPQEWKPVSYRISEPNTSC